MARDFRYSAIIQARMRSTRLPNKILADIGGSPLLWHVIDRAMQSKLIDEVVVATTDSPCDSRIVEFCDQHDIRCFCGSEEDVLDRYYQTSKHFGLQYMVRLTGDCPMLSPNVIDLMIETYTNSGCDYASNLGWLDKHGYFVGRTYPDGLDTEVFSFETLERVWCEATLPSDREHVTPYIYKHPDLFKIEHVTQKLDQSQHRWTVDEPEDLEFVRMLFERLLSKTPHCSHLDIIRVLEENPDWRAMNQGFEINEGYRASLAKDR
jgi:spore coat polysaccharide biosynthesis protein SpsF (cytidylyltransferase family)